MATFLGSGGLAAQRTGRTTPAAAGDQNGPLWTLATPLDDGRQMLLVVDQQARALAIYHVDPTNGTLTLKSTRDISWDMLVEDFNCQEPRPAVETCHLRTPVEAPPLPLKMERRRARQPALWPSCMQVTHRTLQRRIL
jgi:hypothetical protein